jgi:di/tricarboxylate transporter
LGDDTTVLIIAALILAKAVERSGLAHAIADRLTGDRSRAAYGRLAAGVFATTFLIPSTAARAGVLAPLVDRAKARIPGPRGRPAVALMAPLVVVLGAFASPVAAGANLLAIQILAAQAGTSLSFVDWTLLAVPFAVVIVASAVVAAWWVAPNGDAAPPAPPSADATASSETAPAHARLRVAGVLTLVVALWSTAAWHPVDPMLVAVLAAVLVTLPNVGVLTLQEGLKSVDWPLVVLLAGATYISDALARNPLVAEAVSALETVIGGVDGAWTGPLVLAALALTAMLSHVAITSRSARAALLLPPALAIGGAAGVDPAVMALTIASATGFCILTPVGSKALVIFAGSDRQAFSRAALARTGLLLLPVQFALTLLFALLVWPHLLGVT